MVITTANGARTRSLGIVDKIPIVVGKIEIPTSFQVLESKDEILILGNDWLRETSAVMNWNQSTLTILKGNYSIRIPVTFTKTAKVTTQEDEELEDDYDEYEEEFLEEYPIYMSDYSDSKDDNSIKYNLW